jgi:hypothetical protein
MEKIMGILNWIFGSESDATMSIEPTVNVDGSPMCGGVDINGNPYGITSIDSDISTCSSMDDTFSSIDDSFSSFDDISGGGFDDW